MGLGWRSPGLWSMATRCQDRFQHVQLQMFGIITTRYIVSSIIPYSITLINTYWKILKYIEIQWNTLKYIEGIPLSSHCVLNILIEQVQGLCWRLHWRCTRHWQQQPNQAHLAVRQRYSALLVNGNQVTGVDQFSSSHIKSFSSSQVEMNPFVWFENDWNCICTESWDVNGCQWMVSGHGVNK